MDSKMTFTGKTPEVCQKATLVIEQFLNENYRFRRNILNGKVEFATLPSSADAAEGLSDDFNEVDLKFRTLTVEALNTIIRRAKKEQVLEKGNPKTEITEFAHSEDVPTFDPIGDYLSNLPKWDGQNHIARLFSRLPGITTEQQGFLATWLLSAVAHWMQMDLLHGNECVPTLIGAQGCGKTTFFKRLLPPELREYFLDHLNLSNKFDKEMALTNNLIVNLDELEAIRPSQHAALKQTLSKSKVNGRPIYGASQEDRPRYASFVATTNNLHPLTDATGSRRYICLTIPQGQYIDNTGEIDYGQLYAQVVHELKVAETPYWFDNNEVERIQQLNQNYVTQLDMADIIAVCFRKPAEGESVKALNSAEMLKVIQREYPSVKSDHSTKVHIGLAMKELGFEHTKRGCVAYYKAIPMRAA